jgi:iron uptake system component EfeO
MSGRPTALMASIGVAVIVAACQAGASSTPAPGSAVPTTAAGSGDRTIAVALADAACTAVPSTIDAGPVTFQIVNSGANGVTEVELMQGGKILGEKENLAPGMSGTFTLTLEAGDYVLACPGAATPQAPFTVTAAAGGGAGSPAASVATDGRLATAP